MDQFRETVSNYYLHSMKHKIFNQLTSKNSVVAKNTDSGA